MLTVYNVQPEVKRPGDTLKHHVGCVMAQDAPHQNSVQVGLAVRDMFIHFKWFLYTGLRQGDATVWTVWIGFA